MATDCWLRRMVKGIERPYHPWGVTGSWLRDPAAWGIDPAAAPSFGDVLVVRLLRLGDQRGTRAALTSLDLSRV
jgi:hypothetical protein